MADKTEGFGWDSEIMADMTSEFGWSSVNLDSVNHRRQDSQEAYSLIILGVKR